MIDDLPSYPIVDAQTVAKRYGVTPQSAHRALATLVAGGVLVERALSRRRRGRPRRYLGAAKLIDALGDLLAA